ncbi:hypothetical protein PINS_up001004 [Pythium insidiosum]|nr:hypothetical protein PINS_up001004 [Pythium insidiosum]
MQCSYKVGEKRDIRGDSSANVAYRVQYLRRKIAGYDYRNNPQQTEIYLNESYCKLQPIELVWAGVKNPIAFNPPKSMAELEQKIHNGIQRIDSKFWAAAYLSVQRVETEYLDAVDDA